MATLRVKPNTYSVVFLPDGTTVTVQTDQAWDSDDPFVRAHPEYFESDGKAEPAPKRTVSAPVEDMSAVPGARRNR